MIKLNQDSRMAGLFQIEKHAVDSEGNEVPGSHEVVAPLQHNLITNSGLDNMAESNFMTHCRVGSGNAAPADTDTQLQSELDQVSGDVGPGPVDSVEGYVSLVGIYVFGQGEAVGIISELGVAPSTGNVTTRALIRDAEGSPTTIVKGPMDVLTVTYHLREYPDQGDTTGVVVNEHTDVAYNVVSRAINGLLSVRLSQWHTYGPIRDRSSTSISRALRVSNTPLQAWDSSQLTGEASSSAGIAAYTPGSYFRDTWQTFDEESGNVDGGITRVLISGAAEANVNTQPFHMQASFDPPIDKDNTKTLTITLRKSWGRYEP